MPIWSVPRQWPGKTVFIIASGPSVTQAQVDRLRGRIVIAINSSYEKAPWADMLFFGDAQWWNLHCDRLTQFSGRIVCAPDAPVDSSRVFLLKKYPPHGKKQPFGLSPSPDSACVRRTSLTGALDVARYAGARRAVLLGADGKRSADGRCHHHAPHPWQQVEGCWDQQAQDLAAIAAPLRRCGLDVINCNFESAFRMFDFMSLDDVLTLVDGEIAAAS